jgi:hypothetical protein
MSPVPSRSSFSPAEPTILKGMLTVSGRATPKRITTRRSVIV